MTEEILYGTSKENIEIGAKPIYLGLSRFLTVQSVNNFNPNTAEPEALPIYYEYDKTQQILSSRDEYGYYNDSLSSHFRIESTGNLNNSPTRHTIITIVQKFGVDEKATLLIRYWKDNTLEL